MGFSVFGNDMLCPDNLDIAERLNAQNCFQVQPFDAAHTLFFLSVFESLRDLIAVELTDKSRQPLFFGNVPSNLHLWNVLLLNNSSASSVLRLRSCCRF
jgi:hypothetical protein